MGVKHRVTCLKTQREQLKKEAAVQSASLLVFRHMAAVGQLDNAAISAHAVLFDVWEKDAVVEKGDILLCPEAGQLYRCIEPPKVNARTTPKPPSKAGDAWALVADAEKEAAS